jgi:STE24 endopeptidase
MPFLLLMVLSLVCLQRKWPAPPGALGASGGVALTWAVSLLLGCLAWLAARRWQRRLLLGSTARSAVWHRYLVFRRWHGFVLLGSFCILVCFGGWGWFVGQSLAEGDLVVPGTDLVLLAPLFACFILSWAGYQPLEKKLNELALTPSPAPFPGRWSYVGLQARNHFILIAAPLLLMVLQQSILILWPDLARDGRLIPLLGVGLMALMFITIPWFLRLFLGLRPLPDGPLRERLLESAKRLRFRASDILVWNTRFTVVNAMVAGPLPILRYVIVTDRMLVELAPEEIEAVFGHEVGHIKHHHLPFYFTFLLGSLVAGAGLWNLAVDLLQSSSWFDESLLGTTDWLEEYQSLAELPFLLVLAGYIFVVFGFLSRRCERQADLFGCRTVSTAAFVGALEKVAQLNGISRDRPGWLMSWQHSTIARRVEFLQQTAADPSLEPRFQLRLRLTKWAVFLGLVVLCAIMAGW